MTTLTIDPGGPTKRALVSQAYGACGIADLEFGLTADELTTGLRLLNDTAAQLEAEGVALGYYTSDYGVGEGEEGSGILPGDKLGLSSALAIVLADEFGKALQPQTLGRLGANVSRMRARYASIPTMPFNRGEFRGLGSGRTGFSPYVDTTLRPPDSYDPGDLAGLVE